MLLRRRCFGVELAEKEHRKVKLRMIKLFVVFLKQGGEGNNSEMRGSKVEFSDISTLKPVALPWVGTETNREAQ